MKRCFVIGPIGNKFAPLGSPEREIYEEALEVFDQVILPACSENSLDPVRADQIAISGEITDQVFRHLFEDEVVVADLSNGNPNVLYELGLRHTRNLLTIQIGEYGQLPFDVAVIRTLQFSRSERGLIEARRQLSRALAAGLAEGPDLVTATRIWLGQPVESDDLDDVRTHIPTTLEIEEVDSQGFLERMVEVEESFPRIGQTAETIGDLFMTFGTVAEESGRELEQINLRGAPASARLPVVNRFAKSLQQPTEHLVTAVETFVTDFNAIDGAVNGILDFLDSRSEVINADSIAFLNSVVELAGVTRSSMEGARQFAETVQGLAR